MICDTILDAMGHTPLVRLKRMTTPDMAERYFSTPLFDEKGDGLDAYCSARPLSRMVKTADWSGGGRR